MQEYILNYLDQLQNSLSDRVNTQFMALKDNIHRIDSHLAQVEGEMDQQE